MYLIYLSGTKTIISHIYFPKFLPKISNYSFNKFMEDVLRCLGGLDLFSFLKVWYVIAINFLMRLFHWIITVQTIFVWSCYVDDVPVLDLWIWKEGISSFISNYSIFDIMKKCHSCQFISIFLKKILFITLPFTRTTSVS